MKTLDKNYSIVVFPFLKTNGAVTIGQHTFRSTDDTRAVDSRSDYRLFRAFLRKPATQTSSRVFTAVKWFNSACSEANDKATAMVNLAIAFEALLSLPIDKKTDRFIDALGLLLGRTPRLDIWAHQFYNVRSKIVHEGYAQKYDFIATDSMKNRKRQRSIIPVTSFVQYS